MDNQWLDALRDACKSSSQALVAEQIGMSPAVVNQVLKGCYQGNLSNVQRRVEGALLGVVVSCPVGLEIPLNRCLDNQVRPFAATNPMRVQLYIACKTCKHNRNGGRNE